jgi:hypothetical protein
VALGYSSAVTDELLLLYTIVLIGRGIMLFSLSVYQADNPNLLTGNWDTF